MKPEIEPKTVHKYQIHGLLIHSEINLELENSGNSPELAKSHEPDVLIIDGAPTRDWASEGTVFEYAYFKYTHEHQFFFEAPNLAHIWVESAQRIYVKQMPGALLSDITAYILGTAIGALLHQREQLVLHGNAVSTSKGVLLCLGDSGAGKSTLSAALVCLSGELLADDMVSFNSLGFLHTGLPRIKLWQESLDLLAMTSEGLKKVLHKENKFIWPQNRVVKLKKHVDLVVILHHKPGANLEIVELKGPFKLLAILRHVYRPELMDRISTSAQMLDKIVRIFGAAKVIDVSRDASQTAPLEFAKTLVNQLNSIYNNK